MRAILCALAACAALVAVPATASAAPAAVEEYDLDLPDATEGGGDSPSTPAPAPTTPAAPAPTAPTDTAPVAPSSEDTTASGPEAQPSAERDEAATRRDVLFERPDTLAAPAPDREVDLAPVEPGRAGIPAPLLVLVAAGALCIVATMWRVRRFARGSADGGPSEGPGTPAS